MNDEKVKDPQGEGAPEDKPGALSTEYEAEDVFAGAEPWDPIETKLVLWSFVAAFFFLVVLGTLIHIYILNN